MVIETTPMEKLAVAVGGERLDFSDLELELVAAGHCLPPLPRAEVYEILRTKKWERVLTGEELEFIVKGFKLQWPELPPRLKEVARGTLTADISRKVRKQLIHRAYRKLRQFCRSYGVKV